MKKVWKKGYMLLTKKENRCYCFVNNYEQAKEIAARENCRIEEEWEEVLVDDGRKESIIKKYKVTYREQGQMGWDKVKVGTCSADSVEDAKRTFERWADRPSQYRRTFIKAEEMTA